MKNIVAVSVALILVGVFISLYQPVSQNKLDTYMEYVKKFNKPMPQKSQLIYRATLFHNFIEQMNKHNADQSNTWKMGINQFSDITQQEFVSTYLGEKGSDVKEIPKEEINAGFAGEIDWRTRGIVTPIKNQGQCGSCWAFAATAAHESYQIQTRHQTNKIDLSQQQLVDCSTISPYGNQGCNGGYGVRALQYIKDFGQTTQDAYPYKAVNQACATRNGQFKTYGVAQLAGCAQIQVSMGQRPMAVRVDASNWKSYASGVFSNCGNALNHAVFLVATSETAWTIKNSWSAAWGEQGFIRLAKGDTCGVCSGPSFAI